MTDPSSGLSKIVWYYKLSTASSYTSATNEYTAMNGSTAGTKTAVTKSRAYNNLKSGTYNAYAIVYDVAGNSTQSSTISIKLSTVTTASGATATPTSWTNGNVTVTLPTKSGFTTQYQTGSTSGTWKTYSSKLTISSNTTVYYRYYDGVNAGSYASKTISNIDKSAPSAPALKITNVTVNGSSWSITVQASGVSDKSGVSYRYYWGGSQMSSNTMDSSKYTFANSNSSVTLLAKAVDGAGNVSANSTTTFKISIRRLYIRQLYYSLRRDWTKCRDDEVDFWDDFSQGKKMVFTVYGMLMSNEASRGYTNNGASWMADSIYRGVLGRWPDSGGKTTLMSGMSGTNWGNTNKVPMESIANSTEAQNIYNRWGLGAGTASKEDYIW